MVERAVRYFFLQLGIVHFAGFDVLGAVEMRASALDDSVNKDDMEFAAVPVRIHRI